MSNFKFDMQQGHIRSGWNTVAMLRGKLLTDRRIAQYQKEGRYSPEFQAARREMWARRAAKQSERHGNFTVTDGRMIYSPK